MGSGNDTSGALNRPAALGGKQEMRLDNKADLFADKRKAVAERMASKGRDQASIDDRIGRMTQRHDYKLDRMEGNMTGDTGMVRAAQAGLAALNGSPGQTPAAGGDTRQFGMPETAYSARPPASRVGSLPGSNPPPTPTQAAGQIRPPQASLFDMIREKLNAPVATPSPDGGGEPVFKNMQSFFDGERPSAQPQMPFFNDPMMYLMMQHGGWGSVGSRDGRQTHPMASLYQSYPGP